MTIREAANALREKRVSPVELAGAAISRIERLDSKLHAFITVTAEYAMMRARQAEADETREGADKAFKAVVSSKPAASRSHPSGKRGSS